MGPIDWILAHVRYLRNVGGARLEQAPWHVAAIEGICPDGTMYSGNLMFTSTNPEEPLGLLRHHTMQLSMIDVQKQGTIYNGRGDFDPSATPVVTDGGEIKRRAIVAMVEERT